jgi:twinkle protein
VLQWLAKRGISETTARRNRVGATRSYIPALGTEADCIAFPYFRDGELVNVKFRALGEKAFAQVKGAEKILYGLDDIGDVKSVVIVEGEPDKLALDEAGVRNVVSVPDGAPAQVKAGEPCPGDARFSYIANCIGYLDRLDRIVLAVDSDRPGLALAEELARRLGKERCWRVRWPDASDTLCKDANETLLVHGPEVLRECIEAAEPYPISGLHGVRDFVDDTIALYRDGRKRGLSTGWNSLDELMTIRPGELSVVTGVPGSGKSEFIDALAVNLAHSYGWRFALCSFENPPAEHIAKLAEKHLGAPFWDGPTPRMSEADLGRAMDWIADRFYLIRFDDEAPTIEAVLAKARAAVMRHGIRGLVIDPYNEIEHRRPANMTETEYVSQLLGKVKRFAHCHDAHVWFVAHPAKLHRESGSLPVPTPLRHQRLGKLGKQGRPRDCHTSRPRERRESGRHSDPQGALQIGRQDRHGGAPVGSRYRVLCRDNDAARQRCQGIPRSLSEATPMQAIEANHISQGVREERQNPQRVCELCGGFAERGVGAEMGGGVVNGGWRTADVGFTVAFRADPVRRGR